MSDNNILFASGVIDAIDLQSNFSDMEFKTIESIIDTMEELNENPTKYQYILISCQSFLVTQGASDEQIMDTLATVLLKTTYRKFVFIDIDKTYELMFAKSMNILKGKAYLSVASQIKYRNITSAISSMLNADDKPKQIVEKQEKPKKPEMFNKFKENFNQIKEKKDAERPKLVEKPIIHKPKPKSAEQTITEVEVKTEAPKQRDTINKEDVKYFKNKAILFTSVARDCGTTTLAMAMAHQFARQGENVCYVQITKGISTSIAYLKAEQTQEPSSEDLFSMNEVLSSMDISPYVGICDSMHYLTNSLSEKNVNEHALLNLVPRIIKLFDYTVFDIDIDLLKDNPSLLLFFKIKNNVITNSMKCVAQASDSYVEMGQCGLLSLLLDGSFNFIISRYSERVDNYDKPITDKTIVSQIVDTDESLADIEFAQVVGIILDDSRKYGDPFSNDYDEQMIQLFKNMR